MSETTGQAAESDGIGPRLWDGEMTPRIEGNYCLTCGSYQCPHAHSTYTIAASLARAAACTCDPGPEGQHQSDRCAL